MSSKLSGTAFNVIGVLFLLLAVETPAIAGGEQVYYSGEVRESNVHVGNAVTVTMRNGTIRSFNVYAVDSEGISDSYGDKLLYPDIHELELHSVPVKKESQNRYTILQDIVIPPLIRGAILAPLCFVFGGCNTPSE